MVSFDQQVLKERLENIAPLCRRLFALACAERLFPLYEAYHSATGRGNATRLRSALDELWHTFMRGWRCHTSTFVDEYEEVSPGENAPWSPLNPLAENAVAALVYARRCLVADDTENAVWAAVQGYEAVDYIAHTLEGIDFGAPEAETAIVSTEYVQDEIERQLRDLSELEGAGVDRERLQELAEAFRSTSVLAGKALVRVVSKLST